MNRILLTGGLGFIGSHTCFTLLENHYEVIIIDSLINSSEETLKKITKYFDKSNGKSTKISFYKGDIRNYDFLNKIFFEAKEEKKPIDAVIHLAGLKSVEDSMKFPLDYWGVNVIGLINILKIMEKYNCFKIVFSSSAAIYGETTNQKLSEISKIKPTNPYSFSKYTCENILKDIYRSGQNRWKIITLRYFNPIGAHPSGLIGENNSIRPTNIFPLLMQAASGNSNFFYIYGKNWPTLDGTCIRDYIHIMDLADGHLAALNYIQGEKPQCSFFNLGTGIGTSVLELTKKFCSVNKITLNYKYKDRRDGDVPFLVADNSLALKNLNWYPKRDLKDMCIDGWKWQLKSKNISF